VTGACRERSACEQRIYRSVLFDARASQSQVCPGENNTPPSGNVRIAEGSVRAILHSFEPEPLPIFFVRPAQRHAPARVRVAEESLMRAPMRERPARISEIMA